MGNENLSRAKAEKNDEFYTRYEDIEKEMKYYVEHFKDRTIYCNCDDYRMSNFFKYFNDHFEEYELRRLITTGYSKEGRGIYSDRCKDYVKYGELKGNGDFRGEESLTLLKEADIVASNPPFSLFRKYIATLEEYGKKYIVIGNMNSIACKEIFPLIKDNRLWCGIKGFSGGMNFYVDEEHYDRSKEKQASKVIDGKIVKNIMGCIWFTNLDHKKRHEGIYLTKKYDPSVYPTYDNYGAIEVSKVADIPMDYDGVMGVPISILDKYNGEQFEIVGLSTGNSAVNNFGAEAGYTRHPNDRGGCGIVNGERVYSRILIRRRPTWNQDEHF